MIKYNPSDHSLTIIRDAYEHKLTIGRTGDICIGEDNGNVSRIHLLLQFDSQRVMITDVSKNGTIVSGHLLKNGNFIILEDGETDVYLGGFPMKFYVK